MLDDFIASLVGFKDLTGVTVVESFFMVNAQTLFEKMLTIRVFEERLLDLFKDGLISGTTHTYSGQEATAVGLIENLMPQDVVFSNHRCHGHYLARFADMRALLAELMGRQGGVCDGRGGSQHLCQETFYTNGIQGGYMAIAVGSALALKGRDQGAVVVAFIGYGTMGQGAVYESFNLASLWQVPLLVVIENNQYAQTTPIHSNLAGSILKRVAAFDIDCDEIESNDVEKLYSLFKERVSYVREEQKPFVQIVINYRLGPHSKGDDFRPSEEIDTWKQNDPLKICGERLDVSTVDTITKKVKQQQAEVELEVLAFPKAQFRKNVGGA